MKKETVLILMFYVYNVCFLQLLLRLLRSVVYGARILVSEGIVCCSRELHILMPWMLVMEVLYGLKILFNFVVIGSSWCSRTSWGSRSCWSTCKYYCVC